MRNKKLPDNNNNPNPYCITCLFKFFSTLIKKLPFHITGDIIHAIHQHNLIQYTLAPASAGYKILHQENHSIIDLYIHNALIPHSLFVTRYTPEHCPTNTPPSLVTLNLEEHPIRLFFLITRLHNIDPIDFIAITLYTLYLISEFSEELSFLNLNDKIDKHKPSPRK